MNYNPDNTSMRITSGRDSSYRSSDVSSRPKGDPKVSKNFKEVLRKDQDDDEDESPKAKGIIEETDGIAAATVDEKKKKAPMSLFDLTSGKADRAGASGKASAAVESPAAIYSKMNVEPKRGKKDVLETEEVAVSSKDTDDNDKFTTRFFTEQSDLSYVNPLAAAQATQESSVNLNLRTEKAVIPASHIQEIIDQMVAKVTEIKNTGTTETVVTLKHPPMFAGATVVVTAFDNAKNEFNISIENLTQAAKNLVDLQTNRDSLLLALEQKGYAIHILTTTTITETRPTEILTQEQQRGRQDQERQGGQQRRQGKEEQA